jgi:HAD superfamily hydrolase (TIGR01509 family)
MHRGVALIFDLDGVIVDSTASHIEAWRRYLLEHGISVGDLEQRMLGKHNTELVRDFFAGCELTPELISHHGSEKEKLYRALMGPRLGAHLVNGAVDFIRRHADLPLAVASNAEAANVEFILDAAGIRHCFRTVVNGHDVPRPKPSPDIYRRAAELLNASAADCIVFEDSEVGVAAGRAAGMRVVGLTTTLAEFRDVDLTIRDFEDSGLESWLRDLTVQA